MNPQDDLFGEEPSTLSPLPIPEADVSFLDRLNLPLAPEALLKILIANVSWKAEKVTVWGKKYDQPRLIAWYGDKGKNYTYSGIAMTPDMWSPELLELKNVVESVVGFKFNSALLNYYRNERDSMGFHSDDERELGPTPVIASVSVGENRTFVFKHKSSDTIKPVRLNLTSGSLLLMKGDTQRNWKHGIEKERSPCGARVNITFRNIIG
jgi:alkylated DNA repair dioxygenase AlkB